MASEAEIYNMALLHLGVSKQIAASTEQSIEARSCRTFFSTVRDAVLRDFSWPDFVKTVTLGLIEEDPNDEWDFSYQVPSDCLRILRILSGQRTDTRDTRVPYKTVYGASGTILYTDVEDAELEYVVRVEDTSRFRPDMVLAMSARLATYVAPSLTKGDPFKLGQRAMQLYDLELGKAQSNSANEQQPDQEPDSEFIRSRGDSGTDSE